MNRGKQSDYGAPHVFTTSDVPDAFFQLKYGCTLDEFAWRLEAYTLSGVHGTLLYIYYEFTVMLTMFVGALDQHLDVVQGLQKRITRVITEELGKLP